MTAIDEALKNLPSGWRRSRDSMWLYHTKVDGRRIGAILATSKPQDDNFLLNRDEMERLRAGRVDQKFVVAVKNNGSSRELVCHVAADVLLERIQHRQTIDGRHGQFWVLTLHDIDGSDDDDEPL